MILVGGVPLGTKLLHTVFFVGGGGIIFGNYYRNFTA